MSRRTYHDPLHGAISLDRDLPAEALVIDLIDTEPFQRGINSFQLMNDGERWWVVSVFWQAESQAFPIPSEYIGEIGEM